MKELKIFAQTVGQIISEHYPIPQRLPGKRWKAAQNRGINKLQVTQNECVEHSFHEVLKAVKTLYMKPDEVYFEKDSKEDKSDFLGMHSFITSSFYWRLDCAFYYDYEVEFAFHNCPYEAEIRRVLRAFPLERQAK